MSAPKTTTKSLAAIVMLGDVMLGRLVDEALSSMQAAKTDPKTAIWGDVLPLLQGGMTGDPATQLVAANLECAITDHQEPAPKTFNFKLSPRNMSVMKDVIHFAACANNHSLDYYEAGLVETMDVLKQAEISFGGVGKLPEAAAPTVVERAGTTVAFLSYSDHYAEWAATKKRLGINFIDPGSYDRAALEKQVQDAKTGANADLVVVFIHWGPNWGWQPSTPMQTLAHDFIDFGCAAVFGSSSHHIMPIEVYKSKPIVYGAGGFIDDYALDENYRNDLGFMYCMHLGRDTTSGGSLRPTQLELIPTKIVHEWRRREKDARPRYWLYVRRATCQEKDWLGTSIQRLSAEYGASVLLDGTGPRGGFTIPLI